jgi:hypothetical protein
MAMEMASIFTQYRELAFLSGDTMVHSLEVGLQKSLPLFRW